jgi:hypothetical protein
MPSKPVALSVEQIQDLNQKLSVLRHDINNQLSLILAATELIRHKPQMTARMIDTLAEQPPKITAAMTKFSKEFDDIFGITACNLGFVPASNEAEWRLLLASVTARCLSYCADTWNEPMRNSLPRC